MKKLHPRSVFNQFLYYELFVARLIPLGKLFHNAAARCIDQSCPYQIVLLRCGTSEVDDTKCSALAAEYQWNKSKTFLFL